MTLESVVQSVRDRLSKTDQEIFDLVVNTAEKAHPAFQNRMQWQKPTFTLNDNWHHWIFSLNKTKAGMTVTFHKGWLLEDPQKRLSGEGKHLRMLRFTSASQIETACLEKLFREAIKHQLDL